MVLVSGFSNPSHHHRSKVSKLFRGVTQASLSSNTKRDSKIPSTTTADQNRRPPLEGCWRSEDSSSYTENNESLKIKKSQSLGDLLEKENRYTFDDISVAKMQDYVTHSFDVINHIGGCNTSSSIRLYHEKKENCPTLSTDFTDPHQHDCLTSIGNAEWLNENQCGFGDDLSADHLVNLEVQPSCYRPVLTRSQSLNLQMNSPNVIEGLAEPGPHSRSFQNLCSANGNKRDFANIDMLHLETTSHTSLAELDRASNIEEARVSPGHCEDDALEECVQSNVSGGCNEMRDEHMNLQMLANER